MSATISNAAPLPTPDPSDPGAELRLRRSACALFAAKGYDAATVREIIEGAGVTRPVLYYYFRNKEDLFCRLIRESFEQGFRLYDEIVAEHASCRERLRMMARLSIKHVQEEPDLVRMLLRFFFAPPTLNTEFGAEELVQERFARLRAVMQDGIERGELREGDPLRYAMLYSALVDMHVMRLVSDEPHGIPADASDEIVSTFFDGLAARPQG
jgi:TetR/AcrR family transcriptional regulator